jgi:hypothetical protein
MRTGTATMKIDAALRAIKANAGSLTRQQIKTLRGQALSGDADGAIKGLERILRRKE